VKSQSAQRFRWLSTLTLLSVLLLAGCNRSATQGILPEDVTVEETELEDSVEIDGNQLQPESPMETAIDDDVAAREEGVDGQSIVEETDSAESAQELVPEEENTNISESVSTETDQMDSEDGTNLSANDSETTDSTPVIVDAPIIGNSPATYVVQEGDWVFKIARMFNITAVDLLSANPVIGTDQQVYPGQELIIPGGDLETPDGETGAIEGATIMSPAGATTASTYEVQTGDTVFSIALNHGIDVDVLAQTNEIADNYLIYVGQSLVIPSE